MEMAGSREASAKTITDSWQEGRKKKPGSRCSEEQVCRREVWTAKSKATTTVLRSRDRAITQRIQSEVHTLTSRPYVARPTSHGASPASVSAVEPQRPYSALSAC